MTVSRGACRGHLAKVHTCLICGRKVRGNAFYIHAKACARRGREMNPFNPLFRPR